MFVSHSGNYLILQMTAPGQGENFKEIKQTRKHRREERGETAESEEMFLKWKSSRLAAVKILEYKIIRGIGGLFVTLKHIQQCEDNIYMPGWRQQDDQRVIMIVSV